MHFTKIYLQDNFVPNVVEDQFRRKVIGIEVTLTDDKEDIERAKELAEQYIKDYIYKNTVISHNHIEERIIPESELPVVQVEKEEPKSIEEQIISCEVMDGDDGLYSFLKIAQMNKKLLALYNSRQEQIQQTEIQKQVNH